MKILHAIAGMNPVQGGVCQAVRTLIHGLSEIGVKNEVICLEDPNSDFIANEPFPVHAIGLGRGPWKYNEQMKSWLLQNSSKFDCIIIHGLWLYNSYAVYESIKQLKKKKGYYPKFFAMSHGMLNPYFQIVKGRRLKAIRNFFFWKLIEGKVINNADGLLFASQLECLLAKGTFKPYTPKKEVVVGLGIQNPPEFKIQMAEAFSEKCNNALREPYILFLGRIHEIKGIDLLVSAYKNYLAQNSLRSNPKLVIAGPGWDSAFGLKIKKLIESTPLLNENILTVGMIEGHAKWGAIYGCEALILPSHHENFGFTVVEALACKKPVLVSNQVNIWKEIDSERAGLIAEDNQQGINNLLENWVSMSNDEKLTMGLNAQKAYKKYFSVGPAAKRFYEAIAQ